MKNGDDTRAVEHPSYYTGTRVHVKDVWEETVQEDTRKFALVECMEVIFALDLPFPIDNIFKYIWRAGRKEGNTLIRDLKKARFYLDRYIQELEWRISPSGKEEPSTNDTGS